MTTREFKLALQEELSRDPFCKPNGAKTQWTVRCPYCNDKYSTTHGHFSIKIDADNDDAPLLFRCLKCETRGILSKDTLSDLDICLEDDLLTFLSSYNRKSSKRNNYSNTEVEKYVVYRPDVTKENYEKLSYINNRLGILLNSDSLVQLKIVLNLYEFLYKNNIKEVPNFNIKYLNFISHNYIGFLSANNNCLIMRCIRNDPNMRRYIKINLNPKNINQNTFYSIPSSFDLLYTNDVHIHIAEGIFDIISVFYNVQNQNNDNNFYYATCGFGYGTILKYLIFNGLNTGLNIHLYADKDKSDVIQKNSLIKSNLYEWLDRIYIHRNSFENEKDYGVIPSHIIDSCYQLH